MDFNISDFVYNLRKEMEKRFPKEPDFLTKQKHKDRTLHIVDVAFKRNETIYIDDDMQVFEIGNAYAEKNYPYYHILEDSPVIHKRGMATDKSKGSQDKVGTLGKRDYGEVTFNGKTFTKEYQKNVRGSRQSVVDRATRFVKINGIRYRYNASSDVYKNEHYQYIERMLNDINPILAERFNLRLGRTQSTGLMEEYMIDNPSFILDYINIWIGD